MAFIQLSGLVSSIKGKLNGSYFQTKKNSVTINTISSRRKKANALEANWQKAQNRVSFVAKSWKNQTAENIAGWNAFALGYTRVNKNGVEYTPSGYQMFNECNVNRLTLNQALLNAPGIPLEPVDVTPWFVIDDPTEGLQFDGSDSVPAGKSIQVFMSAPQSGEGAYPRGSLRLIATFTAGTTVPKPLDNGYIAQWGILPEDCHFFYRLKLIDVATGIVDSSKLTRADAG